MRTSKTDHVAQMLALGDERAHPAGAWGKACWQRRAIELASALDGVPVTADQYRTLAWLVDSGDPVSAVATLITAARLAGAGNGRPIGRSRRTG